MTEGPGQLDPQQLVAFLEAHLLGSEPTMTGVEVAERVGIPLETAKDRWRALGFSTVPDDEVAFTAADVHALELTERMHELGLMDPESESALIRTLGRSFARLAEWQLAVLGRSLDLGSADADDLGTVAGEVTPLLEQVMNYVWRRHTLSAATRVLLGPAGEDGLGTPQGVGFADIVGYTRQSRSMHPDELAKLVEEFEGRAQEVITEHGGRIIKTIGDEVLFVTDQAADAAEIGLALVEGHAENPEFPELRVGIAYGEVLARLGDVYGPVVNIAARLTSTARPGRVLVDRGLADALRDDDRFRLRRTRRQAVKGYRRLEPWSLRRASRHLPDASGDEEP